MKCQHSSQVAAHTHTHVSAQRQEHNNKYKWPKLVNVHAAVAAVSVKRNIIANATTNSNAFWHTFCLWLNVSIVVVLVSKDTFAWCPKKRWYPSGNFVERISSRGTHDIYTSLPSMIAHMIPSSQAAGSALCNARVVCERVCVRRFSSNEDTTKLVVHLAAAQRSVANTFIYGLEDISTSNKLFGVCIDVKCRLIFRFHWLQTTTHICVHWIYPLCLDVILLPINVPLTADLVAFSGKL